MRPLLDPKDADGIFDLRSPILHHSFSLRCTLYIHVQHSQCHPIHCVPLLVMPSLVSLCGDPTHVAFSRSAVVIADFICRNDSAVTSPWRQETPHAHPPSPQILLLVRNGAPNEAHAKCASFTRHQRIIMCPIPVVMRVSFSIIPAARSTQSLEKCVCSEVFGPFRQM